MWKLGDQTSTSPRGGSEGRFLIIAKFFVSQRVDRREHGDEQMIVTAIERKR
jgi:hypothetical protein